MELKFLTRKSRVNWFRLNRNLHRDLGYLTMALTLVFAISGIALNHVEDWNPNYIVERQQQAITLNADIEESQIQQQVLAQFAIEQPIKASYWESAKQYKLFFDEGGALTLNFNQQTAVYEKVTTRPVFKQINTLHLNEIEFGWIVFSDIYAGILIFLAISGLFMVKGKYSPWRLRKGWLVAMGVVIPCVYIVLM